MPERAGPCRSPYKPVFMGFDAFGAALRVPRLRRSPRVSPSRSLSTARPKGTPCPPAGMGTLPDPLAATGMTGFLCWGENGTGARKARHISRLAARLRDLAEGVGF